MTGDGSPLSPAEIALPPGGEARVAIMFGQAETARGAL